MRERWERAAAVAFSVVTVRDVGIGASLAGNWGVTVRWGMDVVGFAAVDVVVAGFAAVLVAVAVVVDAAAALGAVT